MKARQAAQPSVMEPLLHPTKVPATMTKADIRPDFKEFTYKGPLIAKLTKEGQVNRRALVAEMVLTHHGKDGGATSHEHMLVSINDLKNGNHPLQASIEDQLSHYYATKYQTPRASVPATSKTSQAAVTNTMRKSSQFPPGLGTPT